jgi:hypothetical protein
MKNVNKSIVKNASFAALVTFATLAAVMIALSFTACDYGTTGGGEPGVFTLNVGRAVSGGTDGIWEGNTIADLYHTIWLFDGEGVEKLRINDKKNETITYSVAAGTYEVYVEAWTEEGRKGDLKAIGYDLNVAIKSGTNNPTSITMRLPFVFQDAPGLSANGTVATGTELTANAEKNVDDNRAVSFTWQWNKDGEPITGATANKYKANEAGSYTVTVSARGYESKTSASVTVKAPIILPDVHDQQTWTEAVDIIKDGGNDEAYTINITDNIPALTGSTTATFGDATGIGVTINGNSKTITLSGTGSLLHIGANQTVIMNALTLKGGSNSAPLVNINGANADFSMSSGAVTGHTSTGNGAGVSVGAGGTFTMTGGAVSGNTGAYGGGVFVSGSGAVFNMTGGVIGGAGSDKNTATTGGGGVFVFTGGVFTMSGSAKVSGNTGGSSGGVAVQGGEFTMNSGEVSGNTATGTYGGGVTVYNNGEFIMNDGKVSNNISATLGGGVYISDSGTFTMNGGALSGNSAADSGGGVYVNNVGANNVFHITHGTVYGTNAATGLANTAAAGAALWKIGGTAVYGNGAGTPIPLTAGTYARDVTIEVNNGVLTLPSLSSIAVTTNPSKMIYTVDESFNPAGMVVTATYSDGTTEPVTGYATSGFNSATTGTKTITVSYQGKTTTFSVTVSTFTPAIPDGATEIYVALTANPSATPHPLVTWAQAVTQVSAANGNYAIIVTQNIDVAAGDYSSITNTFTPAGLTLYLAGQTGTEIVTLTGDGPLLTVGSYGENKNQTVTLDGLTLQGHGGNTYGLVRIYDGCIFNMNSGVITGNTSSEIIGGGGVVVHGSTSTFNMSGGRISGNTASANGSGGGVYVGPNTTFNMTGGTIGGDTPADANTAGSGGGVMIIGGTFTMSGSAKVSGNTASDQGGGVYVQNYTPPVTNPTVVPGTFTMSGGEVSGNTAGGSGGGVMTSGGTFNMSDGTISGNTATNVGGGVSIGSGGTFTMMGGEVSGNRSEVPSIGGGGGVYVSGTFHIVTGVVYGSDGDGKSNTVASNIGAALYNASGTAERGTFSGTTWTPASGGTLATTNDTIRVLNGQPD